MKSRRPLQAQIEIDPKYYRPAEVDLLLGNASKAKQKLGWEPKTRFKDLVRVMMDADIGLTAQEKRSL